MSDSVVKDISFRYPLLFLFCVCFLSFKAFAVEWVLRADTRSPDEVFRDGFSAHGNNRNLQQHIRGESCLGGTEDSAFIATTSDLNSAVTIARTYFRALPELRLYIYTIRADSSFYSLEPSVEYLRRRGVLFSPAEHQMMAVQREWVTQRIPPQNIREAMTLVYNRRDRTVNIIDHESNTSYQNRVTQSSDGIIPGMLYDGGGAERIRAFGRLISTCFSFGCFNRVNPREVNDKKIIFYHVRDVMSVILKSDEETPYAIDDWIALQFVD